ncbi:NTP transferase domain-containing protein [Halorhodospira abdelmalekii]|uniref:NTP transferase domain-containing protein n=1 Tax=Halorhodospira abdelmalekii TaxID=421629 RepID=UPI0019090152|nr:NTP transferase domain-containing protein [Halorhodospira abdelmalekii]
MASQSNHPAWPVSWAVIPAAVPRPGEPDLTLCRVGGHPLIGRAILAARRARGIIQVFVSTESTEIAATARHYGAHVVAAAAASTTSPFAAAAAFARAHSHLASPPPEFIALLRWSAPFVAASDIDGTLERLFSTGADAAFAAVATSSALWQPTAAAADRFAPLSLSAPDPDAPKSTVGTAAFPTTYREAGSVYAVRTAAGCPPAGEPDHWNEQEGWRERPTTLYESAAARALEVTDAETLQLAHLLAPHLGAQQALEALPERIGAVVFDFDGVFTDNGVWVSEHGVESVRCSRGDGMGIGLLRSTGVPLLVLSKERNPVVTTRCEKLGLPVLQGIDDKRSALLRWLDEHQVSAEETVYVGNDINDCPCLELAGCAVGPQDSHPDVIAHIDLLLEQPGGYGAVRELCDLLCSHFVAGPKETHSLPPVLVKQRTTPLSL